MIRLLGLLVAALVCVAGEEAPAAWYEAKSKHFVIYADEHPEDLRRFAEKLERFDQAVRFVREMADPPLTNSGRVTVYVLSNDAAIARLARGNALGFYTSGASGAAAFVPRTVTKGGQIGVQVEKAIEEDAIFFHEYAHHLQLQTASVALPLWVMEGFAEFFSTAEILKDGSVGIGLAPKHRATGLMSFRDLRLEQMVGELPRKLTYTQVEQIYGRGWLLMHYLAFEPARRGQLTRYIDAIQNGKRPSEAARAAFGDLRVLERELDQYFKRKTLPYVIVPADRLSIGSIEIRQLQPAEAAMMRTRLRSQRGANKKNAHDIAADARKAAADYPNDAYAQTLLAEAELNAGNFAAAEAAADRALVVQPNRVGALIIKGRSRLEVARSSPASADWKEIRSWFSKANRLDTENAQPLILFYETYLYSGEPPTANAVEALLYSVALAPQDDRVRMIATMQRLRSGRLPDAREMFAPLAFQPHAKDSWREAAPRAMEAISAGDAEAALALLQEALSKLESESRS